MKNAAFILLTSIWLLGCSGGVEYPDLEIGGFIDLLQEQGIDGTLDIDTPDNEDIEYVANYVISKYSSTRVISFFKCTNTERAEHNLRDALKNPKMSGQARNGAIIMAATFYPADEEAVNKIKDLFLGFKFE